MWNWLGFVLILLEGTQRNAQPEITNWYLLVLLPPVWTCANPCAPASARCKVVVLWDPWTWVGNKSCAKSQNHLTQLQCHIFPPLREILEVTSWPHLWCTNYLHLVSWERLWLCRAIMGHTSTVSFCASKATLCHRQQPVVLVSSWLMICFALLRVKIKLSATKLV